MPEDVGVAAGARQRMAPSSSLVERVSVLLPEFEPGGRITRTWQSLGGISSQMLGFEVTRPDGTRVNRVARVPNPRTVESNLDPALREFRTLQFVRDKGVPAPRAVYLEGSDRVSESLYVLEYLDGAPDLLPSDPAAFVRQYAEALAAIHRVDCSGDLCDFLPRHHHRGNLSREGDPNLALREPEVVERLLAFTPNGVNGLRLLHGDFWPGNIIWQQAALAGIIDWEETCVGEPLADLAICRLDIAFILDWELSELFTDLYATASGTDLGELPYWDLWASLRPMRNLADWAESFPHLGRPDVTEHTMARAVRAFVDRAVSRI